MSCLQATCSTSFRSVEYTAVAWSGPSAPRPSTQGRSSAHWSVVVTMKMMALASNSVVGCSVTVGASEGASEGAADGSVVVVGASEGASEGTAEGGAVMSPSPTAIHVTMKGK